MAKLTREQQRLFPHSDADEPGASHRYASLLIPATTWDAVVQLLDTLAQELDLPPLPVSVDGACFRLWLSFAEPVAQSEIAFFVRRWQQRALPEHPADLSSLEYPPSALPPTPLPDGEHWTAFIDAGMGSLFVDEPSLDFAPNRDQQADLLAGYRSIGAQAFTRARNRLGESCTNDTTAAVHAPETAKTIAAFTNPRQFLTAVMNDQGIALNLRIEAAKALLPFASVDGDQNER